MSRQLSLSAAINETLHQEMERDPNVILLGEDVAGGQGGTGVVDCWGGPWGFTKGLKTRWPDRVFDAPISESGFVGTAIGAAAAGLRPIVELMLLDFMGVSFDQFMHQANKLRYMTGGRLGFPLTVMAGYGGGIGAAAQHSGAAYALLAHLPGWDVAIPSNPAETKGLLAQAIRSDDPVVLLSHMATHNIKGDVPADPYVIPFGQARVVRAGTDVTVVAFGRMVGASQRAVERLAEDGIDCELIDPRTIVPLDLDSILASVEKTGRLVVVDEANPRCGVASDLCSLVARKRFAALRAAPAIVTAPQVPMPFSQALEKLYLPSPARIADTVRETLAAG